jgi:N-acetylmuramoyl-L-alanine amidase
MSGLGIATISMLPRVAFAGRNSVLSMRTGVQPGGKTRLVIETSLRPSYDISYPQNQLVISLSNTAACSVSPKLSGGTLVKNISQVQNGDRLNVVADLSGTVAPLESSQIMVLSPNGDNEYRLVLDFVGGVASTKGTASSTATGTASAKKYVVVIDAGHGGKDPGCIGKGGTKEKTVVLSVAKKLKKELDSIGFKTYLTRSNDTFLKLADRAEIAEKRHADLFLSLHANANPSRATKGYSVYTLSEKASDEEAQKLAETENAVDKIGVTGFSEFSKEIRVALSALQQRAVAELSEEYASTCARAMDNASIDRLPGPSIRHAPFAVLRSTVPGALIELGHLSNANEEKLLKSDAHQNKLVRAIVKSVKNYNFDV